LFPDGAIDPADRDEFNRVLGIEYDRIRDFLILHYHATERDDAPFWTRMRTMEVPDTLRRKIELFRVHGRFFRYDDELFSLASWTAVLLGQGIVPAAYDPVADVLDEDRLAETLERMRHAILAQTRAMPSHADFIARHCAAG
ncbi:hypothetical protein LTR94_029167, partial [Friedmanniomyces endolithicus]